MVKLYQVFNNNKNLWFSPPTSKHKQMHVNKLNISKINDNTRQLIFVFNFSNNLLV